MQIELKGVAPLAHLGVIRVEGVDAAKFLHDQLTQDFSLLGLSEARLAAYCSAKGRMQASFYGFKRSHTEILLVCNRDILSVTLKRLSMFVLRAKAKLSDASGDYALFGLAGDAIDSIVDGEHPAWTKADIGSASVVFLYPADGVRRALWLAPVAEAAPVGAALSAQDWCWGEVRSGVAMITEPIVESFCAANAELRVSWRRELQKGLLSRPGSGGAQPVSRHLEAPCVSGAFRRADEGGRRSISGGG